MSPAYDPPDRMAGALAGHAGAAAPLYGLRRLAPRDTPALFEMFNQPVCRQAMDMEPFGSEAGLDDWLARTGAGNFQWVVAAGDTAVAFAGLFIDRNVEIGTGWISLFVHDRHHGRGIGALLMTALIATAHVLDLEQLRLDVFCDNHHAIALYRKFGFQIEARDEAYYLRPGAEAVAAFRMARLTVTPRGPPAARPGGARAGCRGAPPRPADRSAACR